MSTSSNIDVQAPFDPTGYASITSAQLLQLVAGITPYIDKGLVIYTKDDALGNPEIPNANVTTKWKTYLWVRQGLSTINVYAWNDNMSNGSLFKWVPSSIAGIGVGGITTALLADGAVTDLKVTSVDYSKLTNAPSSLPPSGSAGASGGDLTGTYPDPSIASLAVTSAKIATSAVITSKIANSAVTSDKIAVQSVTADKIYPNSITHTQMAGRAIWPGTDMFGNNVQNDQIRVATNGLNFEFFTPKKIVNLIDPVTTTDALKLVRVNAAGNDYEKVAVASIGQVLQRVKTNLVAQLTTTAQMLAAADKDTLPQNGSGTLILTATSFTPKSITSTIAIDVIIHGTVGAAGLIIALFKDAAVDALSCAYESVAGIKQLSLHYDLTAVGTLDAISFTVKGGGYNATTNSYINGASTGRLLGGSFISSITITEYANT